MVLTYIYVYVVLSGELRRTAIRGAAPMAARRLRNPEDLRPPAAPHVRLSHVHGGPLHASSTLLPNPWRIGAEDSTSRTATRHPGRHAAAPDHPRPDHAAPPAGKLPTGHTGDPASALAAVA